jgi:hypothetical protein
MRTAERVRARLRVEHALIRRYLYETTEELAARREVLNRAVERLNAAAKGDFIDVADALLAYEATEARLERLQDQLDRLRSAAEYDRRFSRELSARSDPAAA